MKIALKTLSFCGLALTLFPSFFVALGLAEFELHKTLMLIGTVMWFTTSPFWIGKEE